MSLFLQPKSACFVSHNDFLIRYFLTSGDLLKSYLLQFPGPTPAPALRLRRRLGSARLGRRLFGPTVTHACVCPPASKSVGIKAWRSGLEGLKRRRPEYQELEMGAKKRERNNCYFWMQRCNHLFMDNQLCYTTSSLFFFLHKYHSEIQSVL